jgi:hypothetical protein
LANNPIKREAWFVQRRPSAVDARNGTGHRSVYPESGDLSSDIDLRTEIQSLLANRGHNVFLRKATDRRCSCWNTTMREAEIDCPFCTGTGWFYEDHLYKARKMPLTDPVVAGTLELRIPIGLAGVSQFIFWLEHTAVPGIRDIILEVTLDPDTGMPTEPYNIEAIWNIGQIQDYRDKYGRIEFWGCWVRRGALGKE